MRVNIDRVFEYLWKARDSPHLEFEAFRYSTENLIEWIKSENAIEFAQVVRDKAYLEYFRFIGLEGPFGTFIVKILYVVMIA